MNYTFDMTYQQDPIVDSANQRISQQALYNLLPRTLVNKLYQANDTFQRCIEENERPGFSSLIGAQRFITQLSETLKQIANHFAQHDQHLTFDLGPPADYTASQ